MAKNTKSPVDSLHPQYEKFKDRWEKVRNVINSDVVEYIRSPDPADPKRNVQYKADAQFTNFTNRTRAGLVGSVFRKDPEVVLPPTLRYLLEDADGQGTTLKQMTQKSVGEALEVGRDGLLVDYPPAAEGLSLADVEALKLRPRIHRYNTEAIINWNHQRFGSIVKLNLVVLEEAHNYIGEDGFSWEKEIRYRVLRLIDNTYVQFVYDEQGDIVEQHVPLKADGSVWDEIPFYFIGAMNNDSDVDNAPLYDLACLNIGHLKNSADYEESVFISGQPTLFLTTQMTKEQFRDMNPNGITVGARAGHNLGPAGDAKLLQASPNQLADEAMKRKEEQAVMIGARLITPSAGIETAEAARIRNASENSSLSTIVQNVSAAYVKALQACAMFLGAAQEDIFYRLNEEFYESGIDPNELIAYMQMLDRGIVAKTDFRSRLRDAGLIDPNRSDEDLDKDSVVAEEPMDL